MKNTSLSQEVAQLKDSADISAKELTALKNCFQQEKVELKKQASASLKQNEELRIQLKKQQEEASAVQNKLGVSLREIIDVVDKEGGSREDYSLMAATELVEALREMINEEEEKRKSKSEAQQIPSSASSSVRGELSSLFKQI